MSITSKLLKIFWCKSKYAEETNESWNWNREFAMCDFFFVYK